MKIFDKSVLDSLVGSRVRLPVRTMRALANGFSLAVNDTLTEPASLESVVSNGL